MNLIKAIEKNYRNLGISPLWKLNPKLIILPINYDLGQKILHAKRTRSLNLNFTALNTKTEDSDVKDVKIAVATL